jgi:hypothetical protein
LAKGYPMLPPFDLFSGHFSRNDATWVQACEGLTEAYSRMLTVAAERPGPYFVFSSYERKCVASVDTSAPVEADAGA